ncbi:MAG: hypothetical protein A4E72_00017 [Syntrophus sp. PtaU1.Bin208]|nr:MAG: hypothetical protein A4E72_00017 [Syntrophus sp. PtaU1.Bin208]
MDRVAAGSAEQVVRAAPAPDPVIAGAAVDGVVALVGRGHPRGIALQDIVARIAGEEVVARLPEDRVAALASVDLVVAAARVHEVVSRPGIDDVVARRACRLEGQAVEGDARPRGDGEGPVARGKPGIVVAEDGVVPAAADDQVVAVEAHEHIAAVRAVDEVVSVAAGYEVAFSGLARRGLAGLDETDHLSVDLAEEQIVARPSREQVRTRTALQDVIAARGPVRIQDVAPLAAHEPVIAALPGEDVVIARPAVDEILAFAIGLKEVGCGSAEDDLPPGGKLREVDQADAECTGKKVFKRN